MNLTGIFFYDTITIMKKIFLLISCLLFSFSVVAQISGQLKEQARLYREEGYKLQTAGDLRGAFTFYQKAVIADPSLSKAYNDIGVVMEKLGGKADAVGAYKRAIESNSLYLPAYTNLALIYEEENDTEKAIFYWKQRYRLGREDDYWKHEARKYLEKSGVIFDSDKDEANTQIALYYKEVSARKKQVKSGEAVQVEMPF